MNKAILSAILILALPVCAKNACLSIDTFNWSPDKQIFSFSGRSDLPAGTQIKVTLTLNGQYGPVELATVSESIWAGAFGPYEGKEIVPGKYVLIAKVYGSQQDPKIQRQVEKLRKKRKKLNAAKSYMHRKKERKKEWNKYRKQIVKELMSTKPYFTTMLKKGYSILKKGKKSNNKEKYGSEWLEIYLTLPDFTIRKKELMEQREAILIHPYQEVFGKLLEFFDLLEHLKFSMSVAIGEATGINAVSEDEITGMLLPHKLLTGNVVKSAREILKSLGRRNNYWTGRLPK